MGKISKHTYSQGLWICYVWRETFMLFTVGEGNKQLELATYGPQVFFLKNISAVGTLTRRDKAPHFTLLHPKESSLWLQFIYFLWLALCSRLQRKSSSPNKAFLRYHSNIENCKIEKYNICSLKVIIPEPFDYEISILSRNKLEWTANKSTF